MSKITTGFNDRPKDSALAQSGPGLLDNSSMPMEATEEEALKIRAKLEGTDKAVEADQLANQLARPKHGTA